MPETIKQKRFSWNNIFITIECKTYADSNLSFCLNFSIQTKTFLTLPFFALLIYILLIIAPEALFFLLKQFSTSLATVTILQVCVHIKGTMHCL